MLSERFKASAELFYANPEGYIKSLLGDVTNMTYQVLSVVMPGAQILVDVRYDKFSPPTLKTMYVRIDELKHLNAQGNYFIFERDSKPICLVTDPTDQDILKKRTSIPVFIYSYNKNDKFYSYVARTLETPLHAYSTVDAKRRIFVDAIPTIDKADEKKKGVELFSIEETLRAYKEEVAHYELFKFVNDISVVKSFEETKNARGNQSFVLDYRMLPDEGLNGHVIISDRRRSDLLFYYPHTSNFIDSEQVKFIKEFMAYDVTNLPEKE